MRRPDERAAGGFGALALTTSRAASYSGRGFDTAPESSVPTSDEIRHYEARLAREPSSQAFAALGEAYRRAGRWDEAVDLCRQGVERYPEYATARLVLAKALLDRGDGRAARVEVERFLEGDGDHEPALRIAVECALREGDPPGALRHVRRLALIDPHDRAVAGLERALEAAVGRGVSPEAGGLWPVLADDTFATVAFGELCVAQGLADEAISVFSRILVRHPDDERARARLAELGRPRGTARRPRG
jgi:tetratricopeptide (TPR) repeat protein